MVLHPNLVKIKKIFLELFQRGTIVTTHWAVNDSSDALGDCGGQRQFMR